MIWTIFKKYYSNNTIPIFMTEFFETRLKTKCFDQFLNSKVKLNKGQSFFNYLPIFSGKF